MKKRVLVILTMSMLVLGALVTVEKVHAREVCMEDISFQETSSVQTLTYKEDSYVSETVENEAGRTFDVWYDSEIEWPDTETEILAKFMKHEGGNSEEKRLIADIIVARKDSEEYPDTVKDIITQKRKFYLNTNFWNNLIKVSEEDIEIAKEVLESETHTSFRGYLYKNMPESKNFLLKLGNEIETYETENYIFFK